MKHWLSFGVAGLALAALPAMALAQTTTPQTTPPQKNDMQMQKSMPMKASSGAAHTEIATAHAHALMAQGAQTIDMAHEHLHHVINCLEGSTGADFDAKAGNPCKGKGQGAIPDSKGSSMKQSHLRQAVSKAKMGLKADDLKSAQADASKVASMLQMSKSGGMH